MMKIKGKNILKQAGIVRTICIYYAPIAFIDYALVDFIYTRLRVSLWSILIAILICLLVDTVYMCLTVTIEVICLGLLESFEDCRESELKMEPIASNHGSNLIEVMEAIRNEKLEYLAYFDLEGKKLAEGTYLLPAKCSITTEDWYNIYYRGEDVMEVHNHPGHSNVAFSVQDFKSFLQQDFIRKTVVVTKDYNFILEKVGNGYETSQDDAKAYVKRIDIAYAWLSVFSARLWSIVVARKTAEKFGLKFEAERINQTPTTRKIIPVGVIVCVILMTFCFAKPQVSASAVAKCKNAAVDPVYHGNAQTAGGQQDNIITKD